jgi:hypothetical protein
LAQGPGENCGFLGRALGFIPGGFPSDVAASTKSGAS